MSFIRLCLAVCLTIVLGTSALADKKDKKQPKDKGGDGPHPVAKAGGSDGPSPFGRGGSDGPHPMSRGGGDGPVPMVCIHITGGEGPKPFGSDGPCPVSTINICVGGDGPLPFVNAHQSQSPSLKKAGASATDSEVTDITGEIHCYRMLLFGDTAASVTSSDGGQCYLNYKHAEGLPSGGITALEGQLAYVLGYMTTMQIHGRSQPVIFADRVELMPSKATQKQKKK